VDVVCGKRQIAFYAGREAEFSDFLKRVRNECQDLPMIVGDDAVTRFIYQASARDLDFLSGLSVSWMDLGSMVVLAGESCGSAGEPESSVSWGSLSEFCVGYRRLLEFNASEAAPFDAAADYAKALSKLGNPPWPSQGLGLAYDAAGLLVRAVEKNQARPEADPSPARGAIMQEMQEEPFFGATGVISFTSSRDGSTRNLAILTLDNSQDPSASPTCEYIIGATVDATITEPRICEN
jgi:hypothetical protein